MLRTDQFVSDARSPPRILFDEYQTVDESQQSRLISERVRQLQFHHYNFVIVSQLLFHLYTENKTVRVVKPWPNHYYIQ